MRPWQGEASTTLKSRLMAEAKASLMPTSLKVTFIDIRQKEILYNSQLDELAVK
jgi:hypothetical protein